MKEIHMSVRKEEHVSTRILHLTVFVLLATLALVTDLFAQGSVFTMTNSSSGNEVIVFSRSADGSLAQVGTFPTEGLGTGTVLGNQGAVELTDSGRRLIVVNPGSNDFTLFRVVPDGLEFIQRVASGGQRPVSVTQRGNLIFVLNAGGNNGGADNISGFRLNPQGTIDRVPFSTQSLSQAVTDPSQIAFNREGTFLIVTERASNMINLFSVNFDGSVNAGAPQTFAGQTPSGLAVGDRGRIFVSEAFSNAPNGGAISSFGFSSIGTLQPISTSIPTLQTGPNSVVLTDDGQFGFVSNSGSGTISGFRIGSDGSLSLLNTNGISGTTGNGSSPIELAVSRDSRFLFTLNSGTNELSGFDISSNGSLGPLNPAATTGLPTGLNGLAVE
jgi:6-phosphogluconolactonase (cycloisomerase 2 family)